MLHDLGLEANVQQKVTVTNWGDAFKQCGHLLSNIQAFYSILKTIKDNHLFSVLYLYLI